MYGSLGSSTVGQWDAIWAEWYLAYALDRIAELGFTAEPLRAMLLQFPIGLINTSGLPQLIGMYEMPTASPSAYFTTAREIAASLTPSFAKSGLAAYFASNLTADGRPIWLMAGLAGAAWRGDPGAARAWSWFLTNVYHVIRPADLQADPKWAIVPRTDTNILPAQPTATPPS